ncbi:BTB/POZ domain-containing protein 6-like [Paramacrobiotus metropolitanus]|uniref:BTB/POZ domain-containing protein 6-like n=1 Tax=Paramacrobiotus metropolitanus TaxID=2943436 RepID=UPI0024457121|nr:BTB/POZ domain-containing protein 6-like [Paramacrobiotus metropolitanus]
MSETAPRAAGSHGGWKKLLVSGDKSDVQFAVGRQRGEVRIFSAHKLLLSVHSDVFERMLYGDLRENTAQPIDIPEILPSTFASMLSFVYTGTVEAVEGLPEPCSLSGVDSVFEVLYCADKYNLPRLTELALRTVFRQINQQNCLDYLDNAQRWPLESCTRIADDCLDCLNICSDTVLPSQRFCGVSRETLLCILQSRLLQADENAIYTAVKRWAEAACLRDGLDPSPSNLREMLGPALFHIRFPLMTDAQLADGPVKSGLLLDSEVVALYQYKHAAVRPPLPFPVESRGRRKRGPPAESPGGGAPLRVPKIRLIDPAVL